LRNRSNPGKKESPTGRFYALSLFGMAFTGVCILFITSFFGFQPDQLSLSDRYFPSPTATQTPTPSATPTNTPTPIPNLTATQRAIQATSTSQAIQTTIATVSSQWDALMSDSYTSNLNRWELGEDDDGYANIIRTIDSGVYKWDATSKKRFISWIKASTKSVGDFLLTVEIHRTEGTRSSDYGLIFRRDIGGNYYYFGINEYGYHVLLNYNNKWIDIIEWAPSSAILPESPNRLTVIAKGSHFTFLINDQFVATATDDRISQGITALAIKLHRADQQAVFEFDNFELKVP